LCENLNFHKPSFVLREFFNVELYGKFVKAPAKLFEGCFGVLHHGKLAGERESTTEIELALCSLLAGLLWQ
jgi:hypothetical protein